MQIRLCHPLVNRPIHLDQQLHVLRRVFQLSLGQIARPVTLLLFLRDLLLEITFYNSLQTVLYVRLPIGKDPASQHGAQDLPIGIDLVLLQPTQVEHRIVRQPVTLLRKELLDVHPLVILQLPAVNDHRIPIQRG